jgi:methionyl-tRNA formyltransferase
MKNIILCGYNWSGCKALQILIKKRFNIYVYTHKSNFYESDLISYCKEKKISFTTKKISLKNLPFKPDLILSISYRFKIPDKVLKISTYKPFNLHPSLLPKYKGCSSITWAMINEEKKIGFTYHYMNEKFDSGNIILQKKINIEKFDLQITLYYRLMFISLMYLEEVISKVKNNYKGKKQIGKGHYYSRGAPFEGKINPKWSNKKKKIFVRAMIFPPKPLAKLGNKFIKRISQI